MRGGRPGLIGTVARTAVVAGTATATSHAVNKRIQQKEMQKATQAQQAAPYEEQVQAASYEEQVQAPAGTGITQEEKMAQLRELAELKQMGALTEEEFQQEKQKILAQ
ncbi:SHOCT domain-containing protein [Methanoculleus oceani]|uniref:SHOCT domain-containing protein n=1 Tax=Methanoculleus oceani TaxID=2184756 RepID=A0ABD4TFR9_9EURY|nr:SHOCT domain-containing protein [Methanoculleus sp. CWC-02]MCM2466247.1 hypothetical protein [Methanoculleus sp. CWC-02]